MPARRGTAAAVGGGPRVGACSFPSFPPDGSTAMDVAPHCTALLLPWPCLAPHARQLMSRGFSTIQKEFRFFFFYIHHHPPHPHCPALLLKSLVKSYI